VRAAAAQELFEPGEYLNRESPGYFSILSKVTADAKASHKNHELRHLPTVVNLLNPDINQWISQATFKKKSRLAVNVDQIGMLFTDLDTYHSVYAARTPEEQAYLLWIFCQQEGLPQPSIVMFSGRGLQVKWLLTNPVLAANLPEWNQAQIALVKLLKPFAADINAKDISRVLRLNRTVNTKSGERCRVVYPTGAAQLCPARYDFEELILLLAKLEADIVEPTVNKNASRLVYQKKSFKKVSYIPGRLTLQRLNWFRLYDLRDLVAMRGDIEGCRELMLFYQLNFLILADPGTQLWHEAGALASEIDHNRTFHADSDLSTVYRKATELQSGARVEYRGRDYPPLYTPRNETLINLFKITPDEETHLRTIISQSEKYRRLTAKRREKGVKPREQYLTEVKSAKPWEAQGISRATYFRHRVRV